ncbi:MAG: dolichyl-diphosphooligosaccharide-protein glycosyltransferase [archaeon GW2011_AR19]|nr:MAG: dolichyl-diphosphooligosaccharide-protein glycosyltransferase [archaeon GW2011_AR19]
MESLAENKSNSEDELIKIRKDKIINFLKKPEVWVIGLLIIALILGIYIRSLPMSDHGGNPGLWDVATNTWTLGPDLDPWLFTRMAKLIVNEGSIPEIDTMRNVPLGFKTSEETVLLPYMVALAYKLSKIFYPQANVEFGAALFPVIIFALTIIVFFLFVRELFARESKLSKIRANIISLISTFLMIVIPILLSRTVAGIPEKESAMFFFLFLALFLFLKAWKSEKIKHALIYGILAGAATAGMALVSGLSAYLYWATFAASFTAFILNKFKKKEIIVYSSWWISARLFLSLLPGKGHVSFISSSLINSATFILLMLLFLHLLLWNTKISENKFLKKINLPKNIISILVLVLALLIIALIINPSMLSDKIKQINNTLFKPVTGRWNQTVAENKQPYFTEWVGSFGPFIKAIPIMFWLFFIGSIVFFKKMLNEIKKKDSWILTGLFVLFLSGLMFSRYSPSSMFNGENFISKTFFLLSIALLVGFFIYYYVKYQKEKHKGFEKIEYSSLLLLSLLVLALFSARSAVRLVMILGPIVPIFVGYLIDQSIFSFKNSKEEKRLFLGIIAIILIVLTIFIFISYYKEIKSQAYNAVPSAYNQQWQKAMKWVRDETPQNSVFAHWWDYGYWLQSIGERATVTDGGNMVVWWNYLTGRLVLTGDNQKDALEFLYSHDANYLLIDSSDIGKYGAFSSIGSSENYDRLSFIPTIHFDKSQSRETSSGMMRVYSGGVGLDEDIIYNLNNSEIFLPSGAAGIGGVILQSSQNNESLSFIQPTGVFVYNGQQYNLPLRYLEYNNKFVDFGSGLEGTIKIIQKIEVVNGQVKMDDFGSMIYISPRVMRGYFAQKYLLNDPFNKFLNFKLVHSEDNLIVSELKKQGVNLNEFVYYQGIQGPIKIWEIKYTGNEEKKQEYLDRDSSKYLSWEL